MADVRAFVRIVNQGATAAVSNGAATRVGVDTGSAMADRQKKEGEGSDSAVLIDTKEDQEVGLAHARNQDANPWTKDRHVPTRWTIGPKERSSHPPPATQDVEEADSVNAKKGAASDSETGPPAHRSRNAAGSGSTIVRWMIWDRLPQMKWTTGAKPRSSNRPHPRTRIQATRPMPTHKKAGRVERPHPRENAPSFSSSQEAKRRKRCRPPPTCPPGPASSETPNQWRSSTWRKSRIVHVPNPPSPGNVRGPKALEVTRKGDR